MWNSRVYIQPKVLDAKVRVFRSCQGETHFSFVRNTGLETLAGMALFQISSYVTVLVHCWDLPQRGVGYHHRWIGMDGLLWYLQVTYYFLFCF